MKGFNGSTFKIDKQSIAYKHTYESAGLNVFDELFLARDIQLGNRIKQQRQTSNQLDPTELMDAALALESFVLDCFGLNAHYDQWQQTWFQQNPLSQIKKLFFKQTRRMQVSSEELVEIEASIPKEIFDGVKEAGELFLAQYHDQHPEHVDDLVSWLYVFWQKHPDWGIFYVPHKRDSMQLVQYEEQDKVIKGKEKHARDGFSCTSNPPEMREMYHESHYCIYCHQSETDFCRKGFPEKKGLTILKQDVFGEHLTGCPLDEKISEMNALLAQGSVLAAFIVVMMDNPMVPATGHRICNECMRSCIYQKQDPVNVPKIETYVLNQVLALPWGVEIYDLLCRWHPLRVKQWLLKPKQDKQVFIMGMGPAGFSMAHHLLMEGYQVFGADGLDIDPLPDAWVHHAIKDYQSIYEQGETRPYRGFGGVSEYGITARWDKNYLKLIQIMLLRRAFVLKGGIRFGGNLVVEDVWRLGFKHLTIAVGAGLPKGIDIPNSMAPGMRQANDFLMALHQGAYQVYADLEVRLPAIVIGSGLTAIDTATEVQAYYVRQVERLSAQYALLKSLKMEVDFEADLTMNQKAALHTMLLHAEQIKAVRINAKRDSETPYFGDLIQSWGGVTVVYRRSIQDSPAYRLNAEEIDSGLQEGILYRQGLVPIEVQVDGDGHVNALVAEDDAGNKQVLPAGAIFVATGAAPNVAYSFEHRDTFEKDQGFYATYRYEDGLKRQLPGQHCKDGTMGAFTGYSHNNHTVSLIGDGQKAFHGSVVRAIASAKHAYSQVCDALSIVDANSLDLEAISKWFDTDVVAVESVSELPWYKITLKAPSMAQAWQPGQFIRLTPTQQSLAVFPVESDGDTLIFYLKERLPLGPITAMGPSGVRLSRPKTSQARVLLDVDAIGVNPAIAWIKALVAEHHEVYVVACDASKPLLSALFPELTIHTRVSKIPRIEFTHVWVFASPERMKAIDAYRQEKGYFNQATQFVAATYGPMQCMLKGVCAQCLQWQIDPATGRRTKAVYACSWQHQPMDLIDQAHAKSRQHWNPILKHINQVWFTAQKEHTI